MSINVVVLDGIVKAPALRYDANGKPELRFTLVQTENDFPLYLPCTAVGAAAERLASELEDGQHIVVASGKLCYRKRTLKGGEQSRLEILVWQADVLTTLTPVQAEGTTEANSTAEEPALHHEAPKAVAGHKTRRPRYPKALQQPWTPGQAHEGRGAPR